jgi:hypothetical protein
VSGVYVYVLEGVCIMIGYKFFVLYARRWMSDVRSNDVMCVCIVVSREDKII